MAGGESEENTQVPAPPVAPADAGAAAPVRPSRRAFLLGGGLAVAAGAGVGVGAEYWRDRRAPAPPRHVPAALRAALAAERDLIAGLDAALPGAGTAAAFVHQARADHVAHERALAAAVFEAGGAAPASSGPTTSTAPPAPVKSVPQLRQAETAASRSAARRARQLTGRDAALLASIAACEATHAELLA